MKKNKIVLLLGILPLFGLFSCNKEVHTHTYNTNDVVWNWTPDNNGYKAKAIFKCTGCSESITKEAAVTSEKFKESTCIDKGILTYKASVEFNGATYSDNKSVFLPLADHHFGSTSYTWNEDYSECVASKECQDCHHVLEADGVVTSNIKKESTCETNGLAYMTATFDVDWAETQTSQDIELPKKAHEYGEDLLCTGCHKSFKTIAGLSDATEDDTLMPATLSDYGQSAFDLTNDHTFIGYDFAHKGDFNLTYKYRYTQKTGGDTYYAIYIFNGRDESGLVLHFSTNRTGEGTDVYAYRNFKVSSAAAYKGENKVKDLPTGRAETGHYYIPSKANLTANGAEDTNIMNIKAKLVDRATNEYYVTIATGGSESTISQLTTDYDHGLEENALTLRVTLGATYFNTVTNACTRFSLKEATAVHASDNKQEYTNKEVIYRDCDGKVYAKKTFTSEEDVSSPLISKEGYKFLGWCDQYGNEPEEITANGKYVLVPRFIEDTKENEARQTLSEFGFLNKDTTKWFDNWKSAETISENGMQNVTSETTLVETIFKYRYQSTSSDKYPIFGFTYDATDESARVNTRIDLYNSNKNFRGYIYGKNTSLGNAGNVGTNYNVPAFQMVDNNVYLVRIQIVKNVSDYTINLIIQSLGSGDVATVTKNFTYTLSTRVDFTDPLYTKMCVNTTVYAPLIKDAYHI